MILFFFLPMLSSKVETPIWWFNTSRLESLLIYCLQFIVLLLIAKMVLKYWIDLLSAALKISCTTYLDCLFTYLSKLVEGNRGGGSGCAGCAKNMFILKKLVLISVHPDFKTFRHPCNLKIWSFQIELFILFNICKDLWPIEFRMCLENFVSIALP